MRVDGFFSSGGFTQNTGGDILSRLKPGDTVRAQVVENSGSDLALKLADGSVISASATNPLDAADGEYVNFVFKGTVDGKPVFEVAGRNVQPQADTSFENIKNTLTGLNLPVTEQNIELARALIRQNVPVNSESMSKIINLMSKNTELKPDSAAFLTGANMTNDQNSIDKLQNLLAGRLKISNDIGELLKLMGSDGKNAAEYEKPAVINYILGRLAHEIAAKGQNPATSGEPANNSAAVQNRQQNISSNAGTVLAADSFSKSSERSSPLNNAVISGENNMADGSLSAPKANSPASTAAAAEKLVRGTYIQNNTASDTSENDTVNDSKNNSGAVKAGTDGEGAAASQKAAAVYSGFKNKANMIEQQISNLFKGGEPLGKADLPLLKSIGSRVEYMIKSGEITADELSAAKQIAGEIDSAVFKIMKGEEGSNLAQLGKSSIKGFENAIESLKNLFVRIDGSSDEINPVKLYKNMEDAIQTLKAGLQHMPVSMQEAALKIISNLESNMNFINQLNNYSSYVQIPLSIFNQNTTGELYMLKRGSKSKKLDASQMTVLISLDSTNIGRIDTLLSVDKKNISTNFRLENSEVFDVLKENHKQLYTSLLEKGYRLVDFTYRLMDEPLNVVNFEEEAKKEFIKSPNNIDVLV
ncbi:flagellar hook-length control protein FliK [Ruminiclostridium sufflavum DSM 19573]|uniref:Flagellar hook-length control protein FliK n=1 Tax=Ruminiclostridium sufflavum DSM 19573 TaxID=1121337 RepID=A0A318XKV1_9FIRM|nr:flagellar hook-length control protein FliK [Ruminiclostridium sufflavum]PYG87088.1 flagellar hook-length control protein FliK [Ruminiclostridium sufflavum DSM 19573]